MKKGQEINGYLILEDFRASGLGIWTFAEKNGEEYFIKEFLSPIYPVDGSPGKPETKKLKKKKCRIFEEHQKQVLKALRGKVGIGGNLIVAEDFFRNHTKYYKVTVKIDTASVSVGKVALKPLSDRLLLCKTVAHSLRTLHKSGIVHGDLKPDNILIKATRKGNYTTKLIDFDDSYFSGNPPPPEIIVGTQNYYSPELAQYIVQDETLNPEDLKVNSDIFALGIIFHEYLTGKYPEFDNDAFPYVHEALLNDSYVTVNSEKINPRLSELLSAMLEKNWKNRPAIQEVFSTLKKKDIDKIEETKPKGSIPYREKPSLGGKLLGKSKDRDGAGMGSTKKSDEIKKPSLGGKLLEKSKDRDEHTSDRKGTISGGLRGSLLDED